MAFLCVCVLICYLTVLPFLIQSPEGAEGNTKVTKHEVSLCSLYFKMHCL